MAAHARSQPLSQLLSGVPATLQGLSPDLGYRDLKDDSRQIEPGDIYLAIPGKRSDGHNFVESAAQRGAVAHIVEQRSLATFRSAWEALPLIVVEDTSRLRPQLAGNHAGWPHRSLDLVGITGTNGKTTVTHLLSQIWQKAGVQSARLGTTSNRIADQHYPAQLTTPFPIELQHWLGLAKQAQVGPMAMEVSSHAIAQARVASLDFRAIALTSFSQDHLDFHETMQDYLETKCALTQQLGTQDHPGLAVAPITAGAPQYEAGTTFLSLARKKGAKGIGISVEPHPQAQVFCTSYSMTSTGLGAQVQSPWGPLPLRSPLVGLFNLENLLCAVTIALDLGLEPPALIDALAHCHGAPGRLERVLVPPTEALPAVYVDYAHTPDAVMRAGQTLQQGHQGRLIVVLGCGGDRDRAKRPQMARAALQAADVAIFTSDNPRTEDPESIIDDMVQGLSPGAWTRVCDRRQAITRAIELACAEDRVLIAGKGHEDYQIIGARRLDFDDRVEARQALTLKATSL